MHSRGAQAAPTIKRNKGMTAKPRTVLGDLADWELPALDDEMEKLIALLQQRKITVVLDEHCLRKAVYDQLWEQVRAAGAAAANQAIAGWLKGGADGCPYEGPSVRRHGQYETSAVYVSGQHPDARASE